MLVAKLPGSMWATQAMNAGSKKGRTRKRVRWRASATVRWPSGSSAREAIAGQFSRTWTLSADEAQVGQVAVALVELEAVADEELVRDREADVADGQVVDQPAVGPVEQRDDSQ